MLIDYFLSDVSETDGFFLNAPYMCLNCRHSWVVLCILASKADTRRQF